MRFPLPLTTKIAGYMIAQKLRGTKKFATVLQLEPLHTCNLTCTGCGRIREYSTSLKDMMSLEDCLGAAEECNAPMISICGGEPLIYPHIEALVKGLLEQKRIVYICTNAMFMRKKMREWLASRVSTQKEFVESKITALVQAGLISEKDATEIRKGPKDPAKPTIGPVPGCTGMSTSTVSREFTISSSSAKVCSKNVFSRSRWRRFSAIRSQPTRPSTKKPTCKRSSRCSIIFPISASTATRFRLVTNMTRRKRTWSSG